MKEETEGVPLLSSRETSDRKLNNNDGSSTTSLAIRSIFLSLLGAINLIAFWSYYTSFPGLLSSSSGGIEPVGRIMPFVAPSLYRHLLQSNPDNADAFCELAAVVGILLSCIVTSGGYNAYVRQHGLLYLAITVLYSILTRVGGTFYSFQWDTLLLETNILTAICYAPWTITRTQTQQQQQQLRTTTHAIIGAWPLRFLLFKLMFMSGVVKIQATCPTWQNLTALEYHFATQCLPGPLAWHVHQLHPFLLRLSVAATLWIEIPGTYLLLLLVLSSSTCFVRIGVALQILLQLVILLTGNYNFFNLLTIALCLVCLDDGHDKRVSSSKLENRLGHVATGLFLVWSCWRMFSLSLDSPMNVSLKMTKRDCDVLSERTVPLVTVACLLFVFWKGMRKALQQKSLSGALHTLVCVLAIGITAVPMCSLTRSLGSNGCFVGSKQVFAPLHQILMQPYRLSNGYGLFRRMTGVGPLRGKDGWAGQPPSIVQRPEIILEGVFEDDDGGEEDEWTELSFRWKPGDVNKMPLQVAPHQPRLDWQMWFAALGNPRSNLWFLNLVRKLLDNCHPVQHLLGDPALLLSDRKLVKIRAKLYNYDFTRLDTEWNQGIPGAKVINATSWKREIFRRPEQYWDRQFARMYLGEITRDNPGLEKLLAGYGYPPDTCADGTKKCRNLWCYVASHIRTYNLHLVPIFMLSVYLLYQQAKRMTRRRRRKKTIHVSQTKKTQ